MGSESEFGKRARRALKQAGCAVYPVETGATASGFPDLAVVHKGGISLVELKSRRNLLLANLASALAEGPGQRAFARQLFRRSAVCCRGASVSERPFLLVECMDGVALMAGEETRPYLAACWEDLPSGEDLRDALRAWRISVMPTEAMEEDSVEDCCKACAAVYECCTGIRLPPFRLADGDTSLADAGGKERARGIARDICDRGRIALLMDSMRLEAGERYEAPLEGGNGYVILSKEG